MRTEAELKLYSGVTWYPVDDAVILVHKPTLTKIARCRTTCTPA